MPMTSMPSADQGDYSTAMMDALREGFAAATRGALLAGETVEALVRETCERGLHAEHMVVALKSTWQATPRPTDVVTETWDRVYLDALTRALAQHFKDILP